MYKLKLKDLIMPCVLAAADFKPDVQIVEGTQEDEEEWDYLPLGENFKKNLYSIFIR